MKKLKILFIQQQLVCGGAEKALFDLISLMDKSKFDITVLVICGGGEWEQKFLDAGVRVVNLFSSRVRDRSVVRFFRHNLRKLKIRCILKWNPRKLLDHLFPDGMDVVVAYSTWEFDEIAFKPGAKHVKFIHGNIANNPEYCEAVLRIRDLLPQFHKIVCVSEESCCAFRKITGLEQNVEMHFNPLERDSVCMLAQQPVDLPGDVPLMCAVGRMAPEKGYERLVRIHKRILEQGIVHKLVIVGDGSEMERIRQAIQETGTRDSVILAGYQSNPYPYMLASRFMVCSSFTEGLPVIAMEALSLEIPIVSAVPSIGEAFGDTVCGIITENDDDSLEQGIKKMLCDDAFYAQIKQGARERSAFFDGRRMVKELEEMFMELVEEK